MDHNPPTVGELVYSDADRALRTLAARGVVELEATVGRLRRLTHLDAIEAAEAMRPPG